VREVAEWTVSASRAHPVLTDVVIAAVVTVIVLALAPGTAIVGIGLVALAIASGGTMLLRRRAVRRRAARRSRSRSVPGEDIAHRLSQRPRRR
jgi:hypothetical protein